MAIENPSARWGSRRWGDRTEHERIDGARDRLADQQLADDGSITATFLAQAIVKEGARRGGAGEAGRLNRLRGGINVAASRRQALAIAARRCSRTSRS
jgi:hypothetical protein